MAVKLRLKRMGRTNGPFFRLNAIDSRSPRDEGLTDRSAPVQLRTGIRSPFSDSGSGVPVRGSEVPEFRGVRRDSGVPRCQGSEVSKPEN